MRRDEVIKLYHALGDEIDTYYMRSGKLHIITINADLPPLKQREAFEHEFDFVRNNNCETHISRTYKK